MLMCNDDQLLGVLDIQSKLPLIDWINNKRYRVSDTPLSYRQINELGNDDLINDDRENARGWRRFSLKELLYFTTTVELKKLGVENDQLRPLWKLFFENHSKDGKNPRNCMDDAVCMVLGHIQVALLFNTRGEIGFYTQPFFDLMWQDEVSYVHVNFNRLVGELLKKLGHKFDVSYQSTSDRLYEEMQKNLELTDKERELVRLMRDGGCDRIEITMRDGKMNIIRGTKIKREEFSSSDLARLLEAKAYATVTIHMENGRVVVHEIEEKKKA